MFEVITSLSTIASLNRKLSARLKKAFVHVEPREITYPSGHFSAQVYFEHDAGTQVRGWSPNSNWADKHVNYLVVGAPNTTDWVEITVQLNFPAASYDRSLAGAFVKDEHGEVFLAHRGKLTKGMGGLKKLQVLDRFTNCITAQDGDQTNQLILIVGLEAPDMIDRLFEFAVEARRVATELGARKVADAKRRVSTDSAEKQSREVGKQALQADKLSDYFEEFSGESWGSEYTVSGKRIVEHGAIVSALAAHLGSVGPLRKSKAIDLAVVGRRHVDLYEVKTSAKTTDLYTGIGQLILHGEAIAGLMGLPVHRHLVLPEPPPERHSAHIAGKAETNVITFRKVKHGYHFDGI